MNEQMLPIVEAARLLHSTPINVLMHIKKGLLVGVETNIGWEVSRDSLEMLMNRTGDARPSSVCSSGCAKKHACGGGCS